jgi:hypothetical protein
LSGPSTRSRLVTWTPPLVDPAEITAKSGLRGGALLDSRAIRFESGLAEIEGAPAECHYNPIGAVHGALPPRCSIPRLAAPSIPREAGGAVACEPGEAGMVTATT